MSVEKPGLQLPPPGKTFDDLQRVGTCIVCHVPLYSWISSERQEVCGNADCEHPDELCRAPECARKRRRHFRGNKKIKNPCKFPRLRDQPDT